MKSKAVIQDFKTLLGNVEKRPNMYISEPIYPTLVSFLNGYLLSLKQTIGLDLEGDFRKWMHLKYKSHFSLHEAWYIFTEIAKKDSDLAFKELFEHWNEFLASYKPQT